jgi:hypothetical protein
MYHVFVCAVHAPLETISDPIEEELPHHITYELRSRGVRIRIRIGSNGIKIGGK